ncbi:MAG: hypothetical protein ACUVQM_00205 [Candidatus Hadarchaeaceae archaeon]
MLKKIDEAVIADHGRRIVRLCDDFNVLNQRLFFLERRISAIENTLAELTKLCRRLDVTFPDFEAGDR